MNPLELRIGDAERDEAAAALGEHYAQGRLSVGEHGERLDAIWAARTRADLLPVFRDLPGAPVERPAAATRSRDGSPGRRSFRHPLPTPLLVLLGVLLVVTVVTHLPFVLLGFLLALFLTSRHRAGPRRHW